MKDYDPCILKKILLDVRDEPNISTGYLLLTSGLLSGIIEIALEVKDMEGSRQPVPPLKAVKASQAITSSSSSEAPSRLV